VHFRDSSTASLLFNLGWGVIGHILDYNLSEGGGGILSNSEFFNRIRLLFILLKPPGWWNRLLLWLGWLEDSRFVILVRD
jgi:hypothetical protein